jgi:formate dehydrogenase maturation protein FdhE
MKEQVENFALDLGDYKNRIQIEREEMADILAKNFEVNGERHDASDFEWAAHQLLMAGYRKQREGVWKYHWFDSYCSVCGRENKADLVTRMRNDSPYCPGCGAKMKG